MLGASALASLAAIAKAQSTKVFRIGYVGAGFTAGDTRLQALQAGLRDLGYIEGSNIVYESRWAEGKFERLGDLMAEMVRLKVDVIVTHTTPGALAAKRAGIAIPVVVAAFSEPVRAGVANSLSRPGGNITGGIFFNEELNAKLIALLKEMLPHLTRAAFLFGNADDKSNQLQFEKVAATGMHLKINVQKFNVLSSAEIAGTMAAIVKLQAGAMAMTSTPVLYDNAKIIADLAIKSRLPAAGPPNFAEAGGLLGYGVSIDEMFRRSAVVVDKILKGARPGDIPIEQAAKFDLVVNMKTAKALGIWIPRSVLVQATRVIE
jgi:putative ABC transport system substrate-binding protein